MRKFLPWIVVGGILLIAVFWFVSIKNGAVKTNQEVNKEWGNVETSYQRRNDLIGNLVNTVKGAADFEKQTLTDVIAARSKATSINIDASNLTPEKLAEFQKAQDAFGTSLGRLMAVAEQYPQLQAVGAFRDFQAQYEGMENRIATERRRFNELGQDFNTSIRRFPRNVWAGIFDFNRRNYFESSEVAEVAPDIKSMREGK